MINIRKLLGPRCPATSPTIQHHPTTRESPPPPKRMVSGIPIAGVQDLPSWEPDITVPCVFGPAGHVGVESVRL